MQLWLIQSEFLHVKAHTVAIFFIKLASWLAQSEMPEQIEKTAKLIDAE